jgi:hypothetical protein
VNKTFSAVCIAILPFLAAAPLAQAAPPPAQWEALPTLKPWTGDLDGMVRRHTVRSLAEVDARDSEDVDDMYVE